ncbi:MAG TPA: NAD(P)H-dependent oxidoreductase [Amycolatopsis sp.]|jgi:NAD(P)H-dependent FMN reductase|nr:NAD(P)H-dependent oxidoreductase [Amycolatopsis sp.]
MSSEDLRVATIVGSVRNGRFGHHVGAWVDKQLSQASVDLDMIDLADLSFPDTMDAHPDAASFAERIGRADAVIVITPEYNHSFPGPLKTAIDTVRDEWRAKAVGFVSYGGMAGGLRAVEALRLVFAELHAVTVRDTVSLHNPWGPAADPEVEYPDQAAGEALRTMTRQLLWWASALRIARHVDPYPS